MLPGLAAGATGALGLAQAGVNILANNEAQKRNREKLEQLMRMEAGGQLGLTGTEERLMQRRMNDPVAQAAQAAQSRAARIAATMGEGASGGDLAQLRQEAQQLRAGGAQNTALAVSEADRAAAEQQKNEIEQRMALKLAMRRDDIDQAFNAASQLAGAAGQAAGAPPNTEGVTDGSSTGAAGGDVGAGGGEASTAAEGSGTSPDASGAADAVAAMDSGAAASRGQAPNTGRLSKAETKQLSDLAEKDPRMFAQIFQMALQRRGVTGG